MHEDKDKADSVAQAIDDWHKEEIRTNAKLEINRVIWQYGSPTMTLHEAEKLATEFWGKLMNEG